MTHGRTTTAGTRLERLAEDLAAIEDYFEYDVDATLRRAAEIERAAEDLGDITLRQRARLVTASMWRRTGDLAAAARTAWEVNAWAVERGDRQLLDRSHAQLSSVYDGLGDVATSLEHALLAVGYLDEDTPPRLRAARLMRLADNLAILGSFEAARERFDDAERLAVAAGDNQLRLMILNNLAYAAGYLTDNLESGAATVDRIRRIAAETGEPLNPNGLDTIARIEIALGRYSDAEATARSSIDKHDRNFGAQDADSLAEFWLTLTAAQRHQGHLDSARDSLDHCTALCEERKLGAVRVRAIQEQAELYAAAGDTGRAFTTYKAFYTAEQELLSTQREAQARTRQVMFEVAEARQEAARFREQARRDPLTGLPNRRFVEERLATLLEESARTGSPVTVAMADIDHFKRVNDTCSHDVGDQVLIAFAALLEAGVRGMDTPPGVADIGFAARLGGEEFLLVLTGVGPIEAVLRLDDLRRTVATHPWQPLTGAVPVTVSIGVALAQPDSTQAGLLARADASLYTAKHEGRNRVCVDPEATLERRALHGRQ